MRYSNGFEIYCFMRLCILYVFLLVFNTHGFGQKLLFYKKSYRQAYYKTNDVISFRLQGSREKITGKIKGFEDSLIVFEGRKVDPRQISHLYVDAKTKTWYILRYKYEKIFMFAGITWLVTDLVNSGQVSPKTLVISGSLIGASLLARLLISDSMKIKGKRKLLIVD